MQAYKTAGDPTIEARALGDEYAAAVVAYETAAAEYKATPDGADRDAARRKWKAACLAFHQAYDTAIAAQRVAQ